MELQGGSWREKEFPHTMTSFINIVRFGKRHPHNINKLDSPLRGKCFERLSLSMPTRAKARFLISALLSSRRFCNTFFLPSWTGPGSSPKRGPKYKEINEELEDGISFSPGMPSYQSPLLARSRLPLQG